MEDQIRRRTKVSNATSESKELEQRLSKEQQCLVCKELYNPTDNDDSDSCKLVHEIAGWRRGDISRSEISGESIYYYYAYCKRCGEMCLNEAGDSGPTVGVEGCCRLGDHTANSSEAAFILNKLEKTRVKRVQSDESKIKLFYIALAILFVLYWLYPLRFLIYDSS